MILSLDRSAEGLFAQEEQRYARGATCSRSAVFERIVFRCARSAPGLALPPPFSREGVCSAASSSGKRRRDQDLSIVIARVAARKAVAIEDARELPFYANAVKS